MSLSCLLFFLSVAPRSALYTPSDFTISFWVDPIVPPAQFPLEYARIASAGFTAVLGGFGATNSSAVAASVSACEQAKLLCIPSTCETPDSPGGDGSCVGVGLESKALAGYQLYDEPQPSDFPKVAAWMASVAQRTQSRPGLLRFVNLLPNYASFASGYEGYIKDFIEATHPDLLSFDHYPLFYPGSEADSSNTSQAGYLRNLQSIRAAALENNLPFWNFLNAMPFNARPDVTEAQLRWQVYSSLAHGAKGVLYFCYWTPTGDSFKWSNAIMTPRGGAYVEGPHFAQVARLHTKLLPMGRLLLSAVSTAVVSAQGTGGGGGGGDSLTPISAGPVTAVGSAIPSQSWVVLAGVFSGDWGGGRFSSAVLLHNHDTSLPLLLSLQTRSGAVPYECPTGNVSTCTQVPTDTPFLSGVLSVYFEAGDARLLFFP